MNFAFYEPILRVPCEFIKTEVDCNYDVIEQYEQHLKLENEKRHKQKELEDKETLAKVQSCLA